MKKYKIQYTTEFSRIYYIVLEKWLWFYRQKYFEKPWFDDLPQGVTVINGVFGSDDLNECELFIKGKFVPLIEMANRPHWYFYVKDNGTLKSFEFDTIEEFKLEFSEEFI